MEKKELKVVHISALCNAGAGTAASRIHEALLKTNINSTFLSLNIPLNSSEKAYIQFTNPKSSPIQRIVNKFISIGVNRLNIKLSQKLYYTNWLRKIRPSLDCEWVSLPFSKSEILTHDAVKDADIIHLHWVDGILDYPSFFKKNLKPVVWTLHDMNPFQGIFHYKQDEISNAKVAKRLDRKIFKIKKRSMQRRKFPLSIVGPSRWILKAATESSMFDKPPTTCIRYPLDTSIFFPKKNKTLKEKLKISENNTIFLFVTQTIENRRKGFSLLIEALRQIKNSEITLLVIGHSIDLEISGLQIVYSGSISNDKVLADYYSLADAFVIPSLEDNLPNVMIESLACGTPVLSFNIGGMSEVIIDGINGLKAYEGNHSSLKDMLEQFLIRKNEFESAVIRDFALNNFSDNLIASEYIKVYNDVLGERHN